MRNNAFSKYFSEVPSFIISGGIAVMQNESAEKLFSRSFVGARVGELLRDPFQYYEYKAVEKSNRDVKLEAMVSYLGYEIEFVFSFFSFSGCRLAVASEKSDAKKFPEDISYFDIERLACDFSARDLIKSEAHERFLFDIPSVAERLSYDIEKSGSLGVRFEINKRLSEDAYFAPSDMGIEAFVYLYCFAAATASELSAGGLIQTELSAYGEGRDIFELRISTVCHRSLQNESLYFESYPDIAKRLEVCRFISNALSVDFNIVKHKCGLSLSFAFGEIEEDVDFKSHNQFDGYVGAFNEATSALRCIKEGREV